MSKSVEELIEDLIVLGWDKEVTQVKEKYGTLRFYINGGTHEIHDRIEKAEADSAHICEDTGKPGKLREDLSWIRTLSDEEYNKIPRVSDNFTIGPDGAYEHTDKIQTIDLQQQLIELYENQIMDLTMMSKIELGDDVIAEIKRLKELLNKK